MQIFRYSKQHRSGNLHTDAVAAVKKGSAGLYVVDWRVVTTYRPDPMVDPDFEDFAKSLVTFGEITGCDTTTWSGYIDAHRKRRAFFKSYGATATDHGHPIARTSNLS